MDRAAVIATLRGLRPDLDAEGVKHLAIFGSRARRDHRPDSDLDVLIEVDSHSGFSLLELVGIEARLSEATGIKTHATMRRSLRPQFAEMIRTDIVEVF